MKKLIACLAVVAAQPVLADSQPADYAQARAEVVNHVACFPHGIDMIATGDVEGGMAIWNECWGENLQSTLNFVGGSMVCPGAECTFLSEEQSDLTGPAMRGALARNGLSARGFTHTHHQLDTLDVTFTSPEMATVTGRITATHFSDHQGPEIHFVHWTGEVAMTENGWRIVAEDLRTAGHSVLPRPE